MHYHASASATSYVRKAKCMTIDEVHAAMRVRAIEHEKETFRQVWP
jgi:hypothetical protein